MGLFRNNLKIKIMKLSVSSLLGAALAATFTACAPQETPVPERPQPDAALSVGCPHYESPLGFSCSPTTYLPVKTSAGIEVGHVGMGIVDNRLVVEFRPSTFFGSPLCDPRSVDDIVTTRYSVYVGNAASAPTHSDGTLDHTRFTVDESYSPTSGGCGQRVAYVPLSWPTCVDVIVWM
jgi:hypothetical protein